MHEEHGSWLNAIVHLLPEQWHGWVDLNVVTSWLIIALLVLSAWLGTRRHLRRPRGLQTVWEMYYGFLRSFCVEQIGPGAEKYIPLLGSLLIYILVMNLFGLIPGFITPTMSLNMTVALALVVFVSVQYFGFKEQGWGYLKHFIGEPAGEGPVMMALYVLMIPLMLIVHIIGELAKPLSLSIRLFGNMFGEETAIVRMIAMGAMVFAVTYVPLPVQFINVMLHLIIAPIQAYVFFMLTAAYIQMATTHEGGYHDAAAHEHDAAAA